jgi:hypothetical protein
MQDHRGDINYIIVKALLVLVKLLPASVYGSVETLFSCEISNTLARDA